MATADPFQGWNPELVIELDPTLVNQVKDIFNSTTLGPSQKVYKKSAAKSIADGTINFNFNLSGKKSFVRNDFQIENTFDCLLTYASQLDRDSAWGGVPPTGFNNRAFGMPETQNKWGPNLYGFQFITRNNVLTLNEAPQTSLENIMFQILVHCNQHMDVANTYYYPTEFNVRHDYDEDGLVMSFKNPYLHPNHTGLNGNSRNGHFYPDNINGISYWVEAGDLATQVRVRCTLLCPYYGPLGLFTTDPSEICRTIRYLTTVDIQLTLGDNREMFKSLGGADAPIDQTVDIVASVLHYVESSFILVDDGTDQVEQVGYLQSFYPAFGDVQVFNSWQYIKNDSDNVVIAAGATETINVNLQTMSVVPDLLILAAKESYKAYDGTAKPAPPNAITNQMYVATESCLEITEPKYTIGQDEVLLETAPPYRLYEYNKMQNVNTTKYDNEKFSSPFFGRFGQSIICPTQLLAPGMKTLDNPSLVCEAKVYNNTGRNTEVFLRASQFKPGLLLLFLQESDDQASLAFKTFSFSRSSLKGAQTSSSGNYDDVKIIGGGLNFKKNLNKALDAYAFGSKIAETALGFADEFSIPGAKAGKDVLKSTRQGVRGVREELDPRLKKKNKKRKRTKGSGIIGGVFGGEIIPTNGNYYSEEEEDYYSGGGYSTDENYNYFTERL